MRAVQQDVPSSQHDAYLLAPGPSPPQHDAFQSCTALTAYRTQHLLPESCSMVLYPQQSDGVAQMPDPPLPAYTQFGQPRSSRGRGSGMRETLTGAHLVKLGSPRSDAVDMLSRPAASS
jgi:hypothetical protein